jgi:hypothetical protein
LEVEGVVKSEEMELAWLGTIDGATIGDGEQDGNKVKQRRDSCNFLD